MHCLYYVAVKKDDEVEKDEVVQHVRDILDTNGFVGDGGFYSSCKADWYVIGGRWSGNLQSVERDAYAERGNEDDCMLIDEKLFKALKKYHKQSEVAVIVDGYIEDEITLEQFTKRKDIVGNYYMVVVDYHN